MSSFVIVHIVFPDVFEIVWLWIGDMVAKWLQVVEYPGKLVPELWRCRASQWMQLLLAFRRQLWW